MQHTNASKTARVPSLVDTLSQGFGVVNRRLWILLIPFALDLLYWLGPRRSTQPLVDSFVSLMRGLSPQADQAQIQEISAQLGGGPVPFDLSPFATLPGVLPKFINILAPSIAMPNPPFIPPIWHIGSVTALFFVWLGTALISMLVTTLYMVFLGESVGLVHNSRIGLIHLATVYGSLLTILLILVGIGLLIFVPILFMAAFISPVNNVAAQIVVTFGVALVFWLLFTTSFSFDAVVIGGVGPLRALLTSLFLVQRSFWSALGLLVLGWVILSGMRIVWQPVATTEIGLVAAMLGSAYISSGLTAAHLIFFRDRLSRVTRRA